jgi:hypothetical protein
MPEICSLLNRLVKIYQIPNVDNESIVYLSEWILDEYKHNDLALIQEALKNPPRNDMNTWRLTPDTIRFWIDTTREKRFDRQIKEESRKRQEAENQRHKYSPETEKMIQDFKNKLLEGVQRVPELTEREIKENGQTRPKAIKYTGTDKEYLILKELQRRYYIECYDKYTGKPNEKWMSFEEWRML